MDKIRERNSESRRRKKCILKRVFLTNAFKCGFILVLIVKDAPAVRQRLLAIFALCTSVGTPRARLAFGVANL